MASPSRKQPGPDQLLSEDHDPQLKALPNTSGTSGTCTTSVSESHTETSTSLGLGLGPGVRGSKTESDAAVYYFGYGPIVHPVVRHRRGVPIASVQAAILYDHRLTFAFGGTVNVLPHQRGYEVYGVLLKFDSLLEWKHFQKFDGGHYQSNLVTVYPLKTPDCPVQAFTFVYDAPLEQGALANADADTIPIEKLPQERYLKLIADGLRQLHIDPEYIDDQIMSVPYTPKTKPENFCTFDTLNSHNRNCKQKPPRNITFQKYQAMCQRQLKRKHKQVYFVIGNKVLKILSDSDSNSNSKANDQDQEENPCFKWFLTNVHGQGDLTLKVHKLVVDPDIPMVDASEDLTPLHFQWAEHHVYEYLQQGGLQAVQVATLINHPQQQEQNQQQNQHQQQPQNKHKWLFPWFCCLRGRTNTNTASTSTSTGATGKTNESTNHSKNYTYNTTATDTAIQNQNCSSTTSNKSSSPKIVTETSTTIADDTLVDDDQEDNDNSDSEGDSDYEADDHNGQEKETITSTVMIDMNIQNKQQQGEEG